MKSITEWSSQFDLYWNNIASDKAPGLEDYEKSVFLTDAQDSVVIAVYKGQLGAGFEATEEVRAYLDTLVEQESKTPYTLTTEPKIAGDNSYLFLNPTDLLFRTWESCVIEDACSSDGKEVPVIPITQDEYWRTVNNPFRGPSKRKVLRLNYSKGGITAGKQTEQGFTELISKNTVLQYNVRYLCRPDPIILGGCSEGGLTIHGKSNPQTCTLPEALHPLILAEAVRLAKAAWNI